MKVSLNFKPHPLQQRILDYPSRNTVVSCGRRWGKSSMGMYACILQLIKSNSNVLYLAPSYNVLKPLIDDFETTLKPLIKTFNKTTKWMKLVNGSVLEFQSSETPITCRGRGIHLAVCDEAAYIPNLISQWQSSIQPALTGTTRGRAMFLSTPAGASNGFHELFCLDPEYPRNDYFEMWMNGEDITVLPEIEPKECLWKSWTAPACMNPYLDKEDVLTNLELCRHSIIYRQEFLATFISECTNPFNSDSMMAILKKLSNKPAVVMAADLASAKDYTVVVGLDEDMQLCYYSKFNGNWVDVRKRILSVVGETIPTLIDSTGPGRVILDEMHRTNTNITGYNFTASSRKDLTDLLLEKINSRQTSINNEIFNELQNFEIVNSGTTQKVMCPESKHDDSVFALGLALYHYKKHFGRKFVGNTENKPKVETQQDWAKVREQNFQRLLRR